MPTYDYECEACQHVWEEFKPITSKPTKKCPECGKAKAKRKIGPGAGVIFKGSGFYQTDYRSESYKKKADAEKKASEGTSSSDKPKESPKKSDSNSGG
jgi:putative FmdB family regulatory protein